MRTPDWIKKRAESKCNENLEKGHGLGAWVPGCLGAWVRGRVRGRVRAGVRGVHGCVGYMGACVRWKTKYGGNAQKQFILECLVRNVPSGSRIFFFVRRSFPKITSFPKTF